MSGRLWIRESPGKIREFDLTEAKKTPTEESAPGNADEGFVIGRDSSADIVLADSAVSRFHARLVAGECSWKIVDLDSSNQTFVNGDPVREATLSPGDQIGIGDCELHLVEEIPRVADERAHTQILKRVGSGVAPEQQAATILATLHVLSQEIASLSWADQLLEAGVRILVEELGADRAAALMLEGEALLCRAAHSSSGHALRGFVLSQTIFREVMQSRQAILSQDTTADSRFSERASVVGEEIHSVIAAPIRSGDRIEGILYVDRLDGLTHPFQTEHLYGVAVAAEILGGALAARSVQAGLERERETLVRTIIDTNPIIGTSEPIQRVREFIRRAAPTESTVLILGETGTGKELVASAIHYESPRRGAPFVTINCAAIPETLVESELFGHERGAFTGAVGRKAGKFEAAHRGTVFLDEVGELPLACQAKLLRLLEERCFERVGGTDSVHVDVRIVAATNRNLEDEVEQGRFREDLFYRLNVLGIKVPPLRERRGDLPLILDHFLDLFCQRLGVARKRFSEEAMQCVVSCAWPGNVRQLRNAIESAVVMSQRDTIEVGDLPPITGPRRGDSLPESWSPRSIQEMERAHIMRVLDHVGWNKSKAAEILGIERSTLYSRIKTYDLKRPAERT